MLRDITLGQYYPVDSVLHRMDPRTKLFGTLVYIVTLFIADSVWAYGLAALFLAAAIRLSRVPVKFMVRGLKSIVILLLISVSFNLFLTPGTPIFKIGFLQMTWEGLEFAAFMAVRVLCMAFVRTLPALAAVQLLEAASYGFFQPAAMEYVSAVTPPEGRATALSTYTAAQMPAGTILANAIAVPVLGTGSLRAVFLLFSALALAGLALLLFLLFHAGPYAAAQKEAV